MPPGPLESLSLAAIIQAFATFGPFGIIIILWWLDMKNMRSLVNQQRADMDEVLRQHRTYMDQIQRNYENNVGLVRTYQDMAKNLKDLIVMNTEAMIRLTDAINQNQFCPVQRVAKRTEIHGVDK